MLKCLKNFWHAISTGWVLEYPSESNGPNDFFDRKDRRVQGAPVRRSREGDLSDLERCGWRGEEARGR